MSFEIPQPGVKEKVIAVLPKTEKAWEQQVEEERRAYEQGCIDRNVEFNPFGENLYSKPQIPFGPYFVHLAEINYGASAAGAFRLYDVLEAIPDGYSYHGKVKPADVSQYEALGVKIVGSIAAFDLDGNLQPGYVNIAVQKTA